jgi:DNA-binding MurR/RpiR family transcriptional regulator
LPFLHLSISREENPAKDCAAFREKLVWCKCSIDTVGGVFRLSQVRERSFRDRIIESLPTLTEGQRTVGDYILANHERAAFLTAAKVGREAGVSETTVMRFTSSLGYDGWPQLQRALQDEIRERLTTVERLRGASEGLDEKASLMDQVMLADIECIDDTLRRVTAEQFERAVEMLLAAREVRVVGVRSVGPLAMYFASCLDWIRSNSQALTHGTEDWVEQLGRMGDQDLIVALTFPRYARLTRDIVAYGKEKGCRVLAITDSLLSPIARYADLLLASSCSLQSFVDSYVAPLSLIGALLTAVAQRQPEVTARNLAQLERGWEKFDIFLSR